MPNANGRPASEAARTDSDRVTLAVGDIERQQLLHLLMQAPAAICVAEGSKLVVTLANDRFRQLVSGIEAVGKRLSDVLPNRDEHSIVAIIERVMTSGEPYVGHELPFLVSDDGTDTPRRSYFNVVSAPIEAEAGQPSSVFFHAVEVTDQVVAQQRLRAVVEQMPAGVVIAKAPSGKAVLSNGQVSVIFGHPPIDANQVSDYAGYHLMDEAGEPIAVERYPLVRAMLHGEIIRDEELRIGRGNGSDGWISVCAAPIRDEDDSIVAAVVVITDITERKNVEREHNALLENERRARAAAEVAEHRTAMLQAVTANLAGAVTAADVGRVVVGQGLAALGAMRGVVALRGQSFDTIQIVASTGYTPERVQRWESFSLAEPSPLADAVRLGRTVVLGSLEESVEAYPHLTDVFERAGAQGWVSVPLTVRDERLGALVFSFLEPRCVDGEDLEYVRSLASQCAQALERARLYDAERSARTQAEDAADRIARLQAVTAAMAEAATREEVAEAALRESIAAVGAAAGGLGVLDGSREQIQRLAMLGYPPEIVEGTRNVPIADLGPIGDTARTGEAIWLETNEQLFSRYPQLDTIKARRAFGATVSIPLIAGGDVIGVLSLRFREERPFSNADRDLIYAIARGCAQALERSRLYEAERAARSEAEAAVRARDEFLSIASHELRTPISALKGATQLLLRRRARGDNDEERLTRTLTVLNETTDRLAALTDDLLDVSRLRTGHLTLTLEPTDLSELLERVVQRSLDQIDHHHEIVLNRHGVIPAVRLDRDRIDQVISNLLENAIKYSPHGGQITVTVQVEHNGVRVSVRDEGIGLPEESVETVFEPFGRAANATSSNLPGMGLGLYICRNIVSLHGGWIRAVSRGEGEGATIAFWLPMAPAEGD